MPVIVIHTGLRGMIMGILTPCYVPDHRYTGMFASLKNKGDETLYIYLIPLYNYG